MVFHSSMPVDKKLRGVEEENEWQRERDAMSCHYGIPLFAFLVYVCVFTVYFYLPTIDIGGYRVVESNEK